MARQRRPLGTGALWFNSRRGTWMAQVTLLDRSKVTRCSRSREVAERLLDELRDEYAGLLGFHYAFPRQRPERAARAAISARTRIQVFERDRYRCVYCGATGAESHLVLDHVIPVVDGGTSDPWNLATACADCNAGKGDLALLRLPAGLAERLASSRGE